MNEQALFSLSYGLFVLTSKRGDFHNGCIINTAMQVTSTPVKISIAVNKNNYTTDMIIDSKKFNLSVLSEKAPFSVFERFGFKSGKDSEKFDGFSQTKMAPNSLLYVSEYSNAYISCTVEDTLDLGTHYMFIATVDDCEILDKTPSMTYSYYFANVKPKPQKAQSKGKVWVCKICGYVYDEEKEGVKFEDLPEDWVCPLCKHPKSDFELND